MPDQSAIAAENQNSRSLYGYPQIFRISDKSIEKPFMVSDGYLYYIDCNLQNQLFRAALKNKGKELAGDVELVVDDAVERFVRLGDVIYYQRPQSKWIYAVCPLGSRPVRIN